MCLYLTVLADLTVCTCLLSLLMCVCMCVHVHVFVCEGVPAHPAGREQVSSRVCLVTAAARD